MSYYDNVYKKRLNRFGNNFQSRVQGQRERMFEEYVQSSMNQTSFEVRAPQGVNIDKVKIYGVLERNKQDYAETTGYLLVPFTVTVQVSPEETQTFNVEEELKLAPGMILDIVSLNGQHTDWMIWWKEKIESSGYNKYLVLRMTNTISWYHNDTEHTQKFFLKGPGRSMITDTLKSSASDIYYTENLNKYALVSATNEYLLKGDYLEIDVDGARVAFVIAEADIVSTPGVGYYTLNVALKREDNTKNVNRETSAVDNIQKQWLTGGDN